MSKSRIGMEAKNEEGNAWKCEEEGDGIKAGGRRRRRREENSGSWRRMRVD